MHNFSFKSGALFCAAIPFSLNALSGQAAEPVYQLKDYVVSAGPVARPINDFASPFSALDTADIQRESGSTLGDLLSGQPGVTATSFGGGASRPIIRGFDGPRVRILDSGIEALDASSTSPDHAVATEPLLVERVEIFRGPSTLLYGSSAIGGVVNVIGREIPRTPVEEGILEGGFELSHDTASDGETALGYAKIGGSNWAISLTGLKRENDAYDIPGDAESGHLEAHEEEEEHGEEEPESGILENSFVETDAYSIGGTWFFGQGSYFGLSFARYESLYGVPGHSHAHEEHGDEDEDHDHDEEHGEESVSIDLDRKRYDAELVWIEPFNWIEAARLRLGYTDYEHTELEGDEPGTVFENEGWEFRGEIAHGPLAIFDEGVAGIQLSDTDFSAIGDEAFTPPATTRNQAFFISEHIHGGELHWDFGARVEHQTVDPDGISGSYSDTALSVAASAIWGFAEGHSLALSLQRSQRHASSTELYADGPHLATEQYEIGDPGLDLETAYAVDLRYSYSGRDWSATVSMFYTYFEDYIFAEETGAELDELPVFHYTAVDAVFWGFEAEVDYLVYQSGETLVTLGLLADYVRGTNEDTNEDLPRIPPLRVGGTVRLDHGSWSAGALLRHNFEQSDTAPNESDTDGFTELQLDLSRSFTVRSGEWTLFAQARNLLDEEIRHHTSFLKDVAPQPGRSLRIGVRYEF
jgi:iron complex outermembrane receptor protein